MKKKKLNEKMGGGGRIGLGGMNSTGPHYSRHSTKYPTGYHTGGMQGDADTLHSQRTSLSSTLEENEEEETEKEENMEQENLYEFFARIAKLPLHEGSQLEEMHCNIKEGHCSVHESNCSMSEKHCDEALRIMEADEVEEASTVASIGGGPATPIGTDAKGKVLSDKERSDKMKAYDVYKKYRN